MTERYYSSTAVATTLSTGVDDSTGSITVGSTTGFPNQFPYTLAIDIDTNDEELVDVTMAAGSTLTVTRGVDGTVGIAHESGAAVRHVLTGRDFQNSRDHEESDTGVHGLDGGDPVVGEATVATLEGKTIDGGDNTLQNVPQSAITDLVSDQGTQDSDISTNAGNISSLTSTVSTHESSSSVHGVAEVLGRTEAQTLTNKSINGDNNSLSNIDQGSINRGVLNLNGDGTAFNIGAGQERSRTTLNEAANVGGFSRYGNTAEWVLPFTGLYLLLQEAYCSSGSNDADEEFLLRARVNGTAGNNDGTVIAEQGGNFNTIATPEAFATMADVIGPYAAGTHIKFTIFNSSGATIAENGASDRKHVGIVYLGPA